VESLTGPNTLLSHLRLCSLFVASYDAQGGVVFGRTEKTSKSIIVKPVVVFRSPSQSTAEYDFRMLSRLPVRWPHLDCTSFLSSYCNNKEKVLLTNAVQLREGSAALLSVKSLCEAVELNKEMSEALAC
jgi:hypothetical protein